MQVSMRLHLSFCWFPLLFWPLLSTLISLTGTYLFLDADIEATIEYIKDCAREARSGLINATKIRKYVAGAIANFTPRNAGKNSLQCLALMSHVPSVC